jgi:hypothetical protein
MAAFRDRGFHQLAEDRRHFGFAEARADPRLHHPTEPRRIEPLEDLRDEPRCTLSETPPCPFGRIGQPARDRARDVEPPRPPGYDDGNQEIVAEELRQRVAYPILVARHDCRVRDRQAERMTEQRGDREPVGQPTDHRRLRKRAHERECWMDRNERTAHEERRGHEHEQAGGNHAHADERGRS